MVQGQWLSITEARICIQRKMDTKKIKMKILLWIQGWSGQLNSWAWTEWDKLHRQDWLKGYKKWKKDEQNLYNCLYGARTNSATIALHVGGGSVKKKTKKFILEFLDFWPLSIVTPLMLIVIVLGAALGWGG